MNIQTIFSLFLSLLVTATAFGAPVIDSVEWKMIAPNLEHASLYLPSSFILTTHMELFRADKNNYSLQVIRANQFGMRKSDTQTLCESTKDIFCINGSFFDEQSKPLGLIIQNGILIQKLQKGGDTLTGVLYSTPQGFKIVHRADFVPGRVLDAIQAGPRLIARGAPVTGLKENSQPSRRSGACVDSKGRIIFFTLRASLFGLAIDDLQRILLHRDIDCVDAINLDGGSSTQYYAATDDAENPLSLEGEDKVPLVLGLKPNKQ